MKQENKPDYRKIKSRVLEISWITPEVRMVVGSGYGCGTGYVGVPEGHPWYGKNTEKLEFIEVHGGITFAHFQCEVQRAKHFRDFDKDLWWIGFDTAHGYSDAHEWTEEAVRAETDRLKQMAIDAWK